MTQVASTNPIERVNKEIKRRCDVIGIFPDEPAIIRLVGALMLEQNDEWAVCRRYIPLESFARLNHNPIVQLPPDHLQNLVEDGAPKRFRALPFRPQGRKNRKRDAREGNST